MSASIFLWLAIAVLVFWCVGVYNRLTRMRARGLAAYGSLEKHLKTLDALLQTHFPAADVSSANALAPAGALPAQWVDLLHAMNALDAACKAVRAAPLRPKPLADLGQAIEVMMRHWQRISSEPADLAGSPVPEAMRAQWEHASMRARAAGSALNQILQRYNESMNEFPARLIVGVLGFKTAGVL